MRVFENAFITRVVLIMMMMIIIISIGHKNNGGEWKFTSLVRCKLLYHVVGPYPGCFP